MNAEKNMSKITVDEYAVKIMDVAYFDFPLVHPKETVRKVISALIEEYASQQNKELIAENQTYISLLDDATKEFNRQEKDIEELIEQLRTESDCVEHMKDVEVNYKKDIEELKAKKDTLIDKITTLDIIDFLNNYTKDFGFTLSRKEFVDFSKNLARKLNGDDINPLTPNNNGK